MTRERRLRPVLVPVLCMLAFASVAMADRRGAERGPMAVAASSSGSLSIFNSRGSSAVLSATGLAPGGSTTGDVTVQNNGAVRGAFSLSSADLAESPGLGGGLLSQRLQLVVVDLGASGTVYTGPLTGLSSRDLGVFEPGEARTYRFTASLPDTGTPPSALGGDNAYQSASLQNTYVWTATELAGPSVNPPSGDPPGGTPSRGNPQGRAPSTLTPLQLRITLLRRQPAVERGRLVFKVWCSNACAFRAQGALPSGDGTAKGKAWASLHHSRKLTLRLSRKSANRLARSLRTKLSTQMKLSVVARDSFGRTATVRRTLALKRVGRGARVKLRVAWSTRR